MTHDPSIHPDPSVFRPERFLSRLDSAPEQEHDPTTVEFGFGRRVCPGAHLALQSLFLNIAMVLATTVVEPEPDAEGEGEGVGGGVRYTSGVIRCVPVL